MAKKPSFEVNHDDKLIAVIHVDKLDQICDIKPRTEFTNSLLNTYRGRPIKLAFAEVEKKIIDDYEAAKQAAKEEADKESV